LEWTARSRWAQATLFAESGNGPTGKGVSGVRNVQQLAAKGGSAKEWIGIRIACNPFDAAQAHSYLRAMPRLKATAWGMNYAIRFREADRSTSPRPIPAKEMVRNDQRSVTRHPAVAALISLICCLSVRRLPPERSA